ncbi:hypothetical protein SAMN05216462_1638 [Xylanibacter ruminicola]|uniref:VirE N-terminal domain-containing protein n=1 Tax=Xylanibacter ruminicola TaxID=839 RepID=A0A1H4BVU8_XYLRU|nr:hypothetical protein [Xylanibacter ruminicola]SEA52256.1 hypothetical protein SAMN05216462_1638 [Xylanibacter ruminicola]
MSTHIIYLKDGVKMMRPVTTRAEYMALRGSNEQQQLMTAIRNGNESLKHRLVQMNYSCLPNADGTLRGSTHMSNTVGMDIDHVKAEEMPAVRDRILAKKDELGLGMLEESARGCGYHLVFSRRPHMSQVENLQWAAQLLGVDYDAQAKDITRVFFTTSPNELIYLDDKLFELPSSESCDKGQGPVTFCDRYQSPVTTPVANESPLPLEGDRGRLYNGMAFSDIIAKYWELFNGGKVPVVGDRNALTFELAVTLRCICGYSLEGLQAIVPNYWAQPDGTCTEADRTEYLHTLENALKEPRRGMPLRLKQVLQALKEQQGVKACGGTISTPPPLPKRLPPLIKLLTRNVPWYYKPAVASAVFPALGAHLHGVHFRYWDNVDHEATFMNLLVGRQSVGKGSIKKPIEYIMEDIRQRDLLSRQREAEWKQKNPSGKQKKDPRPADICIQMLIDNLTDAVFNQRVVDVHNNGQRYIYTIVDEVEALKKVTSSHKADEVGLLIRKAFDNSMAGQERVGADSVSGIAPLRWNFNASTTPPNARKFFYKMVNDGTVSRLDVATIIRPSEDDDEAPILGIYDDQFAAELKPYIDRLDAANGLIECPQARKLALDLKQENADTARLYESEAYRVLSYRANVIAWLKGMVLYVAHGYRWDKSIADFVRWSEQYNLWCKMLYFGSQLEKELNDEQELQRHSGPQNLLELLPDEFTREQYLQMRQQAGRPGPGDSTLRTWQTRGHIAYDETSAHYVKINK